MHVYNIHGLSSCIKDNKSDSGWYLEYILLLLRFYVFLKIQKRDFLRFFALIHTFSRTMMLYNIVPVNFAVAIELFKGKHADDFVVIKLCSL